MVSEDSDHVCFGFFMVHGFGDLSNFDQPSPV